MLKKCYISQELNELFLALESTILRNFSRHLKEGEMGHVVSIWPQVTLCRLIIWVSFDSLLSS